MRLSKAYNHKNLIDEAWLIRELEKSWKQESKVSENYWSSTVRFYDNVVWVKLFFGYMENSQRPEYYSSFGIVDGTTLDAKFVTRTYYCWGERYPGSWDVIRYYRDTMRKLLFPRGIRNQRQLYPNR